MSSLAALQRAFQAHLLCGTDAISAEVAPSPRVSREQTLEVYAHAYRARLIESLAADFPKLQQWMGETAFEACARDYLRARPSTHPSLRWFGRRLAGFLREHPPYAERPALAEMADFEWAQGEVFDARDAVALGADELAGLAPEDWSRLRFELHPATRRIDSRWNVPSLWKALDTGQQRDEPTRSDRPIGWLLWRSDFDVHWRSLPDDERQALDALRAGESFGEILLGLGRWLDESQAAERGAQLLRQWIADGLIQSCSLARS